MALDIRRGLFLTMIFFWTLFLVRIPQYESLTSWPVDICPGNQSEVEAATLRLNCSEVKESINVYHCLPLSNLSGLVEFCYDATSGLIEAGNCMVLNKETLDNYPCGHFTNGCPNEVYFPKNMYTYPACLNINTKNSCYIADPKCLNVRFLETTSLSSVTAMVNKTQTMEATTAINNNSLRVETSLNGNDNNLLKYFISIPLGLLFLLIAIAFVIFWRYKQNRQDKDEELELLNREPPFLRTDIKTNIPEHSIILVCEVIVSQTSPPVKEIFWTKDNVKIDIPINGGKYVGGSLADHSLQINDVNETDVGAYQCSATNAAGTRHSEIIYFETPILRLQGAFSEDNEVTISYSFVNEGSPKVHSIKWTKDGNPLDRNTAKYSGGGLEAKFLKIHSPTEDDQGEYGCEISSILGSAKDSLSLNPPSLKTYLENNVSERSMRLVCEVTVPLTSPSVTDIFWTKDNVKIDIPINGGKYVGGNLATPSLQINDVNETDVGVYQCSATNAAGTKSSAINSLELPILRVRGAFSKDNEVTICYSFEKEGSPKVNSIKWTKDGYPLDRNTQKYSVGDLETTYLKIHSPTEDDLGEYCCEISSILGSVKDSLTLIVPIVTIPKELVVTTGSLATIQPKVKSCPSLERVVWQKSVHSNPESFQDIDIRDLNYLGSNEDPADPKLVISSSTYDDGQYYRLLVFNGIVQRTSNMALLKVESEYKNFENKGFLERFQKYLEEGSIMVCPISQIIIVGEHGVGKTTLLYRLQGRSEKEIKAIKSTRGVECHTEKNSFIITENQLKMNMKGITSLTADPYEISEFSTGNDEEESPEITTQEAINKEEINLGEDKEREIPENGDKATFSDTKNYQRQKNGSLNTSTNEDVDIQDSTNVHPDHKKQPNHDFQSENDNESDHSRQTTHTKEPKKDIQSFIPILKKTLEKNSKLISQLGNKDDVVLDVLDFAGQGEYYATHQTHIRKDAIFIVVVNSSKDFNQRAESHENEEKESSDVAIHRYLCDRPGVSFSCWSPKDYLHYWLNTIRMHGGNSENIIFVGTHKDQRRKDFDLGKQLDDSGKQNLRPDKYYPPVITDLIRYDEDIENDLTKIKSYICKIIMKHHKESRPAKWVKYSNMFNIIREKIPIIEIEDVLEMVDQFDSGMSDTEVADMLKFFHCSGKIIFFNEEKLSDNLILDIQWFIDCFKYIISYRKHVDDDCEIIDGKEKEKLNYYHDTGVLDVCLYEKLLKKENISDQYLETLSEYQNKLGLMFCIKNYKVNESVVIEKGWYVPSINTQEFNPNIKEYGPKDSSPILCFRFKDYLPHDLFGRVIVTCLNSGNWHPFDYRLCKTGADMCYQHSSSAENKQIYLFTSERIITVQFIGKNSMEEGQTVRREIHSILRHLSKFYASSTEYEVGFLCLREKGYKKNSVNHFLSAENKYCKGCSKRFLDEWREAEMFWKDVSDVKHPTAREKEMDSLKKACVVYFHLVRRFIGIFDNTRTPECVILERNGQFLDNLVDIESKLKDLHGNTNATAKEKEKELRNIDRNLKQVSFDLKNVCRNLRKEIFFLTTQNKDIQRKSIPEVSVECANQILHNWSNIILEVKTVGIRHHLWLRKTFLDNKYRFLHPADEEVKFEFQEKNGHIALTIKKFDDKDEGHYYVVIETENGFTVCRKTVTLLTVPMPAIDNSQREKEMDTLFCEDWHKSIGHVVCSDGTAATAFRVGSRYLMAPFHLIKKTFEMYVNKIIEHVLSDPHRSINYSRLLHKLQVGEFGRDIEKKLQNGIYEWLERTKYQILITSLLSALEESGFSCAKDRAVKFIEENLVYVYFGRTREHVNYKPYRLRYDIPFYSKVEEDDIALLEVDWTDLPKPFILEISRKRPEYVTIIGHPVSHGNVQVIDRRCPLIWECDAFQTHCKALSWWKVNYPNFDHKQVKNEYDCMFRREKVPFHCSESTTHGASGGPGIIDLDIGSPKVYLMLQEGIPGFVHNVHDTSMKEILRTCPKECLVESGISMSRVYDLLSSIPQLKVLRDNIFHT